MTEYVVGFALDSYGRVALIEKNRPAWQAGKLNGIGGHVEEGETFIEAMRREFWEETGVHVEDWTLFATMKFPGATISFYKSWITSEEMSSLKTTTDEEVCIIGMWNLNDYQMIPNLSWLIPLAAYTADEYEPIQVEAKLVEAF